MKKQVYILGHPGGSRTIVGKEVAALLGRPYFDLEEEWAKKDGAFLRERQSGLDGETDADQRHHLLVDVASREGRVFTLGGEFLSSEATKGFLKSTGTLIYLDVPIEEILEESSLEVYHPQLAGEDPQEVERYLGGWEELFKGLSLVTVPLQSGGLLTAAEEISAAALSLQQSFLEAGADEAPPVQEAAPPKERKKKRIIIGFGVVIVTALALFFTATIFIHHVVSSVHYVPSPWAEKETIPLVDKDGVINVLLLGTDEDSQEFSDTARADTVMIASLNTKTREISLVSLERGITMPIEGVGEDWLTHVFAYGGPDLVVDTVSQQFDLPISYYARVNFHTFKKIISVLGGVEVELSPEEAEALAPLCQGKITTGENHLSGEDALEYVRLRSIDSDFYRIQRQRNLIQQVLYKLKGVGLKELYGLTQEALPYVQTNIAPQDLKGLVKFVPQVLGVDIKQLTVPQPEHFLEGTYLPDGRILTRIDFQISGKAIRDFIYGQKKVLQP